jgi:molybdopterin-binding protein
VRRRMMRVSARNQLSGKVKGIKSGAVNSEVVIELKGGDKVTAIITKEAIEELGIAVGKPVFAIIKASSVMVGVEH